jgi:hypothetical protein
MTVEQIIADYAADLAAMSPEELLASLEHAGFVMVQPWLDSYNVDETELMEIAANSSELALAA